ncbi:hypothetical protein [Mesomycoplasma ovipneumoniae]|uniref:Uncharacterized protein n=1 Tax=Mesomycoplasma ovipneumoniae 14811 TaxID=1188239 RepID=A0A014L656_9BACT|nr:hypothetical protein [Mesomycoplasma ovipneumoniae]EXU60954.1 Hypothetical protein MOVI_5760 [Mesomycoplasma ovipneumoniae 14811]
MKDIIQLELENLTPEQKEELNKELFYNTLDNLLRPKNEWTYPLKTFSGIFYKDLNELDENLKDFFEKAPADFIHFQKNNKNSLYNQMLKKHDFQDLSYENMVENLTQEQKDEIVSKIPRLFKKLASERGLRDVLLDTIDPETGKFVELKEDLDEEQKNKHALLVLHYGIPRYIPSKFFKNDDQLINYALKQSVSVNDLLHEFNDILNPQYKFNQWIETTYELEKVQKDNLAQNQKFESTKKKMKM